jgi:hypothetical protein
MNRRAARTISRRLLVAVVMLSPPWAWARGTPDSKIGPIDPYLMADRNAEIAMARSAAPPSISRDATVLVLTRHGYETASAGKNGFVCVVERSWMSGFDDAGFWSSKVRGPICFNAPAVRSILPITLKRTELVLAGRSKAEIASAIRAAFGRKELPALEPGAMCFMLSRDGRIGDGSGPWAPHMMFYVPQTDAAAWGADQPGSPVLMSSQFNGAPEPVTVFMIMVHQWSDGTPFAMSQH